MCLTLISLQSSDGVIFTVDKEIVNHMVTIRTMLDHEDEDSDEVTPIPTVNSQVLEKIIQWTEYHKIDHEMAEKIAWNTQYFNIDLSEIFEIIIAADYLEVKTLLNESCRNVLTSNKLEIIDDGASRFYDPKVVTLLQNFEIEYGLVIVTMVDNKYLKYFDIEVIQI